MVQGAQFLTPEGRRRLEADLQFLETVKRKETAPSLRAAIEEGDLTENAGYEESKWDQALVEGRIQELRSILDNARLLKAKGQYEVVGLGARVTVTEQGCDPETYQIVGPAEADPLAGRHLDRIARGRRTLEHKGR